MLLTRLAPPHPRTPPRPLRCAAATLPPCPSQEYTAPADLFTAWEANYRHTCVVRRDNGSLESNPEFYWANEELQRENDALKARVPQANGSQPGSPSSRRPPQGPQGPQGAQDAKAKANARMSKIGDGLRKMESCAACMPSWTPSTTRSPT